MQFGAPKEPANLNSDIHADAVLKGLDETHQILRENILDAQERQTKCPGGKVIIFEAGDRVWLSNKHLHTTRPSSKLDYKRAGPCTVSKIINHNAYKLDLPKTMRHHNVFHVSQPDWYTPPGVFQAPSEPLPTIVD